MAKDDKLTEKQKLFIAEYLIDMNATRAATAAGYSAETADQQGSRLLKNVKVKAVVDEKLKNRLFRLEITADRTMQELAALAYYDPIDLFEDDGSVKQLKDLDPVSRRAIAGFKVNELFEGQGDQKHAYGLAKEVKLADKGHNLERLAKIQGLLTNKVEHSGRMTLEELVCAAMENE